MQVVVDDSPVERERVVRARAVGELHVHLVGVAAGVRLGTDHGGTGLGGLGGGLASFDPRALAEYERCFANPATIHASCEDYRAGASIDYRGQDGYPPLTIHAQGPDGRLPPGAEVGYETDRGGINYGKGTEIYKFEKIKRAKRKALAEHPERKLLDFGIGENDDMADPVVRDAAKCEIDKLENRGYADNGIQDYKDAVARLMQRRFGVTLDPVKEVNHCIGSKTALAMRMAGCAGKVA